MKVNIISSRRKNNEDYLELLNTVEGSKIYYVIQGALEKHVPSTEGDQLDSRLNTLSRYLTINYLCGSLIVDCVPLAIELDIPSKVFSEVADKVLKLFPTKYRKYRNWNDFKEKVL